MRWKLMTKQEKKDARRARQDRVVANYQEYLDTKYAARKAKADAKLAKNNKLMGIKPVADNKDLLVETQKTVNELVKALAESTALIAELRKELVELKGGVKPNE